LTRSWFRQIRRQAFAAHQRLEAGAAFPRRVQQDAPHAGRGLHRGGMAALEQAAQRGTVHGRVTRHDHHFGAYGERQQQFKHGDVERQRGDGGQPVV
jgi:hypothetical protein